MIWVLFAISFLLFDALAFIVSTEKSLRKSLVKILVIISFSHDFIQNVVSVNINFDDLLT